MILVSVQYPGDVQLARALLQAFGSDFDWFLLFGGAELKERMGQIPCKFGFDLPFCLLNAQNFKLVVSSSGLLHPGMMTNLLLLAFFNEIGVPTFEIQHGLFQYGINNVDRAPQVGAQLERGDQLGIDVGYAARNLMLWTGPDGIGYPRSILPPRPSVRRGDFALITSNNHWQIYEPQHREQFGLAVQKLVESRPALQFVWKPHFGEFRHPETRRVLDRVAERKLPNLHIESGGDAEDLIPGCSFAVSSVSTTLVDYQMHDKPVLVYESPPVQHLIERLQVKTFHSALDLPERVASLQANPEGHKVQTGIGPFSPERLLQRFEQALSRRPPPRDHLPTALKYLSYFAAQQPVATPVDVDRLTSHVTQQVARMEEAMIQDVSRTAASLNQDMALITANLKQEMTSLAATVSKEMKQLKTSLEHSSHKLGVLQRSTVAYKLKKALQRFRKRC